MVKKITASSFSRSLREMPLRFLPFALIFVMALAGTVPSARAQFSAPGPKFDNAIKQNDYAEFRQAMIGGENVNGKTIDGAPYVVYAASLERAQMVLELVQNGARLTDRDADGDTALTAAARHSNTDIALTLLKLGADPNLDGARGETALYIAALTNNRTLAKALLDAKADPNQTDYTGATPLSAAQDHGAQAVAALLKAAGAQL